MKARSALRIQAVITMLAILLSCTFFLGPGAAGTAYAENTGKHSIVERSYPAYIRSEEMKLTEDIPLLFIDGADDLPYLEIHTLAELLYFLNTEYAGDPGYELTIETKDNTVILERENGYTLEFDFDADRLVFMDYDAFVHNSNDTTLVDMLSVSGFDEEGSAQLFQRDKQGSFDRYGKVMTVDLGANGIDMIAQDGEYYVPLQTMNDFLLLPMMAGFLFNGQALLFGNDDALFDYSEGAYSDFAELYYSAPTGQRSDALAEYSYNELCLALDTFYGLKEPHDIQSFRETFWQIGMDEVLSGNDPEDADRALKESIDYYLDDLHSVFNEFSYLTGLQPIASSTGIANRKYEDHVKEYSAAREAFYPDGPLAYEEVGNTAYITFDTFSSNYDGSEYYAADSLDAIPPDTLGLIIYAHSQITRENSPIENVVLDLSNNSGGAVDAAVFVLGWMLGDAPFSIKDMATGAMSTSVYRADVNLDREFDVRDTVSDYNLFCLISPVSFSCGNLVPAALKSSQKVTLLGRTSGGGSCVVQPMLTAHGTVFQISSNYRMSFLKNGSFYDIDQGVEPDAYIGDIAHFYDRKALTDYINGLF